MNTTLCQEILEAFSKAERPTTKELVGTQLSRDSQFVIENFAGKRREELPPRLTVCEAEDLRHMTGFGLRYYLPAFLCFLLTEAGQTEDSVLGFVISVLDRDESEVAGELHQLCTPDETRAVSKWLQHVFEHRDDYLLSQDERSTLQRIISNWQRSNPHN